MLKALRTMFIAAVSWSSVNAMAATLSIRDGSIQFKSSIAVPANVQIYQEIGVSTTSISYFNFRRPDWLLGGCKINQVTSVMGGVPVPNMAGTYKTGVPGVAVQIFSDYSVGQGSGWNPRLAPHLSSFDSPDFTYPPPTWHAYAKLIYIGGATGSGPVGALPRLSVRFSSPYVWFHRCHFSPVSITISALSSPSVVFSACTVTTRSPSVALPNISASDLPGVGSTRGDTRFRIGLQCKSGSKVYVTLTDANNPGNRSDALTLSSDSTAGGVGLRLLRDDGSAVKYGPESSAAGTENQWLVGASSEVTDISLTAQYTRTGMVKAGTVKGHALFTMSYQ